MGDLGIVRIGMGEIQADKPMVAEFITQVQRQHLAIVSRVETERYFALANIMAHVVSLAATIDTDKQSWLRLYQCRHQQQKHSNNATTPFTASLIIFLYYSAHLVYALSIRNYTDQVK